MDKEIIFFIIFVVFSILSSLLNRRKKRQTPAPQSEGRQGDPQKKKRPFTFEDILREFEVEIPEPKQQESTEMYEELEEVEERHDPFSYADEDKEKSSLYETFEGTTYDTAEVVNKDLDKKLHSLKNSELYALSQKETNEYAEGLMDPEGLRKAIVLKEILDRKHF